jgi:hypothetical protein
MNSVLPCMINLKCEDCFLEKDIKIVLKFFNRKLLKPLVNFFFKYQVFYRSYLTKNVKKYSNLFYKDNTNSVSSEKVRKVRYIHKS